VHNNLGNALRSLERLDEAVASYRRALEINPSYYAEHPEVLNNLGSMQLELGQLEEGVASYRAALAIRPDYAEAHSNLGIALRLQGRFAEAAASCRRALEINPALASALTVLGDAYADQGQFAEAEALFRRAIAVDADLPEAWAGIAQLRKMTPEDRPWLTEALRVAGGNLPPKKEILLRYAIGKYFDDLQDFDEAFFHYQRANELTKLHRVKHDRRQLTRAVDELIESYDRQWLDQARIHGVASARPVFIVGMPRSGTSLAEQILASHPAVFGAGELTFWSTASATHESGARGENGASTLRALAEAYLRLLDDLSADALRVIDKMPANFLHLGLIHASLPDARIIHLRRNAIDTCLSIYFQDFKATLSYANDLDDLAHYYAQYLRVMKHWQSILPENAILDMPYEELVQDQEGSSRRMLEFIGLPWDARCLDFHQTSRSVLTASKWQVRQRISQSSVGRWRNYERHVEPLRALGG
jgi:tetratricopeptide (TPR) repeat protein